MYFLPTMLGVHGVASKSIPSRSGTRQIEYILFYTFGEPSIWAGWLISSQSPSKPRHTPGIIRKQPIRQ